MEFEKFLESCSFDMTNMENKQTQIVCIFSAGYLKEYSSEFVKRNPSLAKELVASDLYNYLNEEFKS